MWNPPHTKQEEMKYLYIAIAVIILVSTSLVLMSGKDYVVPAYTNNNPEIKEYMVLDGVVSISVPSPWNYRETNTAVEFLDTNILYSKNSNLDVPANELLIDLRIDPMYFADYETLEVGNREVSDTKYVTTKVNVDGIDGLKIEFDAKNISRGVIYYLPVSVGNEKVMLSITGFTRENSDEWISQSEQAVKTIKIKPEGIAKYIKIYNERE